MKKAKNTELQEHQVDLLTEYLKELEKPEYDVLDKEEEFRLMRDYLDHGNIKSKQELIKHNLRLIPYVVKQYNIYTSDSMDLIQAGNMGLLEALENFNPDEGVRFGTYAVFIVKKHILGTASSDSNKVYIPFAMNYNVEKYKKLMEKAQKNEIELTDEEIMKELKIKPATLKTLKMAVAIEYISMSVPIGSDGGCKTYVSDVVPDQSLEDFSADLIEQENYEALKGALDGLNAREYDIVVHTYGLGCDKQSSRELSEKYGVTMERICQIRKHAYKKMQKTLRTTYGIYGVEG